MTATQRRVLNLLLAGPYRSKATERLAVLRLIERGFAELTMDGVVITPLGRAQWAEVLRPKVHVDNHLANMARGRETLRVRRLGRA